MAISDFQETMVFTFYINIDLYIIIIYNYDESYAFYMYLRFTFLHIYIYIIYIYTLVGGLEYFIYSSIQLGISSSQLTIRHIFSEG